jgi:Na+/H+-dicarboxylate symporter
MVILLINTGIILFGIYPALLYLFGKRENPYKWLYAVIGPAITAFLSRDVYFTLASLTKHGKESLGIPRRIGSATFPFFAMFGRAGTAMVTAVSFVVILTSYSSLGITFAQFLWVLIFSFLFSFTLAIVPGMGVFVALSSMCALYGRGIEEGYLILGAVMPILISFGVLLDVITSAFASLLIAKHEDVHEQIEAGDFI